MIILRLDGGLCNRLRTMSAALKLAKEVDCRLYVMWCIDSNMNSAFTRFFMPLDGMIIKEYKKFAYIPRILFQKNLPWVFRQQESEQFVSYARRHHGRGFIFAIQFADFMGNPDFDWLKLNEATFRSVENAYSELGCKKYIGLHIRRTDNVDAITHSPTRLFEDKIREELDRDPTAHFFLATDDENVKGKLCNQFGKSILTRKNIASRHDEDGVLDAIIDLMLLSRSCKLYGSYLSSFSEVAAQIGNIEIEELTI